MLECLSDDFSRTQSSLIGCHRHAMKLLCRTLVAFGLAALLSGCTGQKNHDHGHSEPPIPPATADRHQDHDKGGHEGHHHAAPHGGALVVLVKEFAHIEFVLAVDSGTLTAYVLDGESENAVRLPGGTLEIIIVGGDKLVLEPVADVLTGETVEETSVYRAQSDSLKGVEMFEATLITVTIKGQDFEKVQFHYPGGNEEHEHDHNEEEHHEHESL